MSNDYLVHHGILGQKWGVRRFQNPDGTLTAAGKKRYGISRKVDDVVDMYGKKIVNPETIYDVESDNMFSLSQRGFDAAKTGIKAMNKVYNYDIDPEDEWERAWFIGEDQTFGLPLIADMANRGFDSKLIKDTVHTLADKYGEMSESEKNKLSKTHRSGIFYCGMSYYNEDSKDKINKYIDECVNIVKKQQLKHSGIGYEVTYYG